MKSSVLCLCALSLLWFAQCSPSVETCVDPTVLASAEDPFLPTLPPTQTFELDLEQSTVIEGQDGIRVVVQEGSFTRPDGSIPNTPIRFELVEAVDMDDMLLAGLSTTSNGELLETGGMLWLNATSNGEQLVVNPDKPLLIDVPTPKKVPGMSAWKGERSADGSMNWTDPKPIREYLQTVPLEDLDFLPDSFRQTVELGLPFRGHQVASDALVDSLYYSFAAGVPKEIPHNSLELNEAYTNGHAQVENGAYTKESFSTSKQQEAPSEEAWDEEQLLQECGISPAWIQAMKAPEMAQTFIATQAFARRMRAIHRTCSEEVLMVYLNGLGEDLHVLDSTVADMLDVGEFEEVDGVVWGEDEDVSREMELQSIRRFFGQNLRNHGLTQVETFKAFAAERLTNVEATESHFALLTEFLHRQKVTLEQRAQTLRRELEAQQEAQEAKAQKLADEYREVLWKREKHRMESYSFEWSNTGWINVDKGVIPKTEYNSSTPFQLTFNVPQGADYDRVHTFVILQDVNSIYRMNTSDGVHHQVGNGLTGLNMMIHQEAICVAVGYKGDQAFFAQQAFTPSKQPNLEVPPLTKTTERQLRRKLEKLDQRTPVGSIQEDLDFQMKIAVEKKRQEEQHREYRFIQRLAELVYPCCIYWVEYHGLDN